MKALPFCIYTNILSKYPNYGNPCFRYYLLPLYFYSKKGKNIMKHHDNKGEYCMSNHLKDQSSPYLLQHAENPVD